MPAASKQQQKLMGIVHAIQKGGIKPSSVSKKAQQMAKSMEPGDVKKFAATKHKGLPKKVKAKKEEGVLEQVYAVQKPYSGCQMSSLVHPIDPLVGLGGGQMTPDQVHGVYQDQDQANAVAQEVYEAYCKQEEALEEKKVKVADKIKKAMSELEKRRSACVEAIKQNPMEAAKHKEEAAKHTTTIDELVSKLERIEKSKKPIEKKEEEK